MRKIVPAIMSGGSGTRLWPLSTDARPKQFHALASAHTMIQETALRLRGEGDGILFGAPILIGNASQAGLIAAQLAEVGVHPAHTLLEPVGRNTAATAALAAEVARRDDPEALVLLVPADHVIADASGFRAAIARAAPVAMTRIVTFGVVPTRPETGFGYIQSGEPLSEGVLAIRRFREKPDAATAQAYVESGDYFWNAGIFLFHSGVMLREFDNAPAIRDMAVAALDAGVRNGTEVQLAPSFASAPSEPVDVAIMEKTALGAVVPCDIGWADVGSWSEVWRISDKGEAQNAVSGEVVALDCEGSLLRADGVVIAAAGLKDMIVVSTPEAVLILPKDRAQDVKKLWEAARRAKEQKAAG